MANQDIIRVAIWGLLLILSVLGAIATLSTWTTTAELHDSTTADSGFEELYRDLLTAEDGSRIIGIAYKGQLDLSPFYMANKDKATPYTRPNNHDAVIFTSDLEPARYSVTIDGKFNHDFDWIFLEKYNNLEIDTVNILNKSSQQIGVFHGERGAFRLIQMKCQFVPNSHEEGQREQTAFLRYIGDYDGYAFNLIATKALTHVTLADLKETGTGSATATIHDERGLLGSITFDAEAYKLYKKGAEMAPKVREQLYSKDK